MISIESFILEKLKVTKSKPGDCTLEEFLVWYYFDNTQTIEDLTFEEFVEIDFEPYALEEYFDNDSKKMYDFLMDHLDDEIKYPEYKEHIYNEQKDVIDDLSHDRRVEELENAQFFLAGSNFVKKSLL